MDSERMLNALKAYGADVTGTMERFMGDTDLYEMCLHTFVDDANFAALGRALEAKDCARAFDAAHGLKGVAANLGLQPLLAVAVEIVEPLRHKECEGLEDKYEELLKQRELVRALL